MRREPDPYAAYGRAQASALPLRHADALAFARAAGLLEDAAQGGDRLAREGALKRNQKLWGMVRTMLSDPRHPLAAQPRANLVSLAAFVDAQTLKALISGQAADIRPLVRLNREVSAGLMDQSWHDEPKLTGR